MNRILVIAGFDQSGGAGLLADIKTLEAHAVYGYAVCTAITFQNEHTITRIHWMEEADIFEQIHLCFESAAGELHNGQSGRGPEGCSPGRGFEWVKIGITPSLSAAGRIIGRLREYNPSVKIVMDPVIRSSSGKEFWESADKSEFEDILSQVYVMTPNREEMGWLYPDRDIQDCCRELSLSTGARIFLKGGHDRLNPGWDYVWCRGEQQVLEPSADPVQVSPKHGSGCVLASSLTAGLALGLDFPEAAREAKRYTENFLLSNSTLLGWHRPVL
jgi:hydroxymethylpyrimidine/phosphomethylpyrimidine kinase